MKKEGLPQYLTTQINLRQKLGKIKLGKTRL